MMGENIIAKIIKYISIGFTIIGGISAFFYIENSFFIFFMIVISSLVIGILIYGFGEIIQLLEDIKNNTRNKKDTYNTEIPKL